MQTLRPSVEMCKKFTIEKLKTHAEESPIIFVKGIAIMINNKNISQYIENCKGFPILDHLKRVKRVSDLESLFLLCVIESESMEKFDYTKFYPIEEHAPRYFERLMGSSQAVSLLKTLNSVNEESHRFYYVSVPNRRSLNVVEWETHKKVWPLIYFSRKEELDADVIAKTARELKEIDNPICSGMCLIVDKDIITKEYDTDDVLGHSILRAVSKVSSLEINYLCTGLDAYLSHEPCFSCAMALVHGRIKRVFIMKRKTNGPFTGHKLCYNKNLNHRYPVYFLNID